MSSYAEVLESIFTSENKYTVLQLIKALINAVNAMAGKTVTDVDIEQGAVTVGQPTTVKLTFTFDDDSEEELEFAVPAGARGLTGAAGQDGADGTDGVGVASVSVDANNHVQVTYTNGTTEDAGAITVPEGGTKWYSHRLAILLGDLTIGDVTYANRSSNPVTVDLLSTRNTAFDSNSLTSLLYGIARGYKIDTTFDTGNGGNTIIFSDCLKIGNFNDGKYSVSSYDYSYRVKFGADGASGYYNIGSTNVIPPSTINITLSPDPKADISTGIISISGSVRAILSSVTIVSDTVYPIPTPMPV